MKPATQDAYERDWLLFVDWCRARDLDYLPASAETVEVFLSLLGSVSSRRRGAAAIRFHHRAAGLAEPALIRGRPGRPLSTAPSDLVDAALAGLPRWGWTAGLFGRRDAVLLVLRFAMALSPEGIAQLDAGEVIADGQGGLRVHGREVGGDADPALCPGCIWARWVPVMQRVHRFTPTAELAKAFTRPEEPPAVDRHDCERSTPGLTGPALMTFDRWGSAPLPVRAPTSQGLRGLSHAHRAGTAVQHPIRDLPRTVESVATPPPPPAPFMAPYPEVAELGWRRKLEGFLHVDEASQALHLVVDQADALNARLDQLLADADALRSRVDNVTRLPRSRALGGAP